MGDFIIFCLFIIIKKHYCCKLNMMRWLWAMKNPHYNHKYRSTTNHSFNNHNAFPSKTGIFKLFPPCPADQQPPAAGSKITRLENLGTSWIVSSSFMILYLLSASSQVIRWYLLACSRITSVSRIHASFPHLMLFSVLLFIFFNITLPAL